MCIECGCGRPGPIKINGKTKIGDKRVGKVRSPLHYAPARQHAHEHVHPGDHAHAHPHDHGPDPGRENGRGHGGDTGHPGAHPRREVEVNQSIFAANDRLAERNRSFFADRNLLVLNVVSSPGSGKTTLVQKTIEELRGRVRVGVIVGDLETDNDARRLRTTGAPVVQITTGTLCHLDADMVARALGELDPNALDVLVIENVGNLVCPSSFDLGEDLRVALLSVTEGEDKPLKYPPLFLGAHAVLLTKTDLSQACEFDRDTALANIRRASPKARIFELSARTGEGMEAWCEYLKEQRSRKAQ